MHQDIHDYLTTLNWREGERGVLGMLGLISSTRVSASGQERTLANKYLRLGYTTCMSVKGKTMADEPTRLKINLVHEIQLLYPTEPNWSEVDNDTLAALVVDFASEPSCATTAIGLMGMRKDARANDLAHWLIVHEQTDQWLKEAAHEVLESNGG